jgi:hypothetical protein
MALLFWLAISLFAYGFINARAFHLWPNDDPSLHRMNSAAMALIWPLAILMMIMTIIMVNENPIRHGWKW